MMSLRTFLAISALVAVCVADTGSAQRVFNFISRTAGEGNELHLRRYFFNDFKLVVPGSNKTANKDAFVKTLLKPEFSKHISTKVDPDSVVEGQYDIAGKAVLKGETQSFDIIFVMKMDYKNDAGFSLKSINGPEALIQ